MKVLFLIRHAKSSWDNTAAHRLSAKITHLPTSAVAEFAFDVKSWSRIGKDKPAKAALIVPSSHE